MAQIDLDLFIRKGTWDKWYAITFALSTEGVTVGDSAEANRIASHVYAFKSEAAMKTLAIAMQQGKAATKEAIKNGEIFRKDYGREAVYKNLFRRTRALWFRDELISEVEEGILLESIIREAGYKLGEAVDWSLD